MTSAYIVGEGGREHQLGLSIANDVDRLYFAPGNVGTEEIPGAVNLNIKPHHIAEIVDSVKDKDPDLIIVGPEEPLALGLVDLLGGRDVLGPSKTAARLEASKASAISFMDKLGIPHPISHIVTDKDKGKRIMGFYPERFILKTDKLANGKGVVAPEGSYDAQAVLAGMLDGSLFNHAGKDCVVIQEKLHGPELSVTVVCDGSNYVVLPFSQDHKKLKDNDQGPNTGGMGAYAPFDKLNDDQKTKIDSIIQKSIEGAIDLCMPIEGILYIGIMLAEEYGGDPVVLEYNVRFGYPEAQCVLPLIEDAYELFCSAASGDLEDYKLKRVGLSALTVCLASEGYPGFPVTCREIYGLTKDYENVIVTHGATKRSVSRDKILTNGGRVIFVTGLREDLNDASKRAYAAINVDNGIHFEGMQYRTDIGAQAISI